MTSAVEKRKEAIQKIADYWKLTVPQCMWSSGCSKIDDLQIGHVYGDGWKERMSGYWTGPNVSERRKETAKFRPPQFYWTIVKGYDLSRLNLLCPQHNSEAAWWPIAAILRFKEWKYTFPDSTLFPRVVQVFRDEKEGLDDFLVREHEEWKSLKGY